MAERDYKNHAEKLHDLLLVTLENFPWCWCVNQVEITSAYSVRVLWQREDLTQDEFDLTHGDLLKRCCHDNGEPRHDYNRRFIALLREKMGVEALDIKEETAEQAMDRLSAQGRTIKQYVVACEKCETIMGDQAKGKACPRCKVGYGVIWEIEQPKFPVPGIKGRRRIVGRN